jgi:cyclopropane-fatty-acyl-phospholipid synthase
MRDTAVSADVPAAASSNKDSWLDRLARHTMIKLFHRLAKGELILIENGERRRFGDTSAPADLRATVEIPRSRAWRDVAFGGSVGAGRSYIEGSWSCNDLPAFFRIFLENQKAMLEVEKGWARVAQPFLNTYHALRRNTRRGSRRNIEDHYDLGNDFFQLLLDETMTYSCGIFENDASSLCEASEAKYDRLCRKIKLGPEDHLLEIGTGWGGFAIHAARNYGCRITTTTISSRQYELASQRIEQAGLSDRITLLLEDYRDLEGRYDKLVSIEMIEAVGHQYYDKFFETCGRLLERNGMMALQAITITDQVYEQVKNTVDFIKRYIFPGSTIPSVTALCKHATRASDLRLFHLEDITSHYVTTLRKWRERFLSRIDEIRALGYQESFIRAWDFYLTYCEAGFQERWIGDVQMVLVKPECRLDPILGQID